MISVHSNAQVEAIPASEARVGVLYQMAEPTNSTYYVRVANGWLQFNHHNQCYLGSPAQDALLVPAPTGDRIVIQNKGE